MKNSSSLNISKEIKNFLIASKNDLHVNEKDVDDICKNYRFFGELLKRHSLNATPD
jgi:hypothetical protein